MLSELNRWKVLLSYRNFNATTLRQDIIERSTGIIRHLPVLQIELAS